MSTQRIERPGDNYSIEVDTRFPLGVIVEPFDYPLAVFEALRTRWLEVAQRARIGGRRDVGIGRLRAREVEFEARGSRGLLSLLVGAGRAYALAASALAAEWPARREPVRRLMSSFEIVSASSRPSHRPLERLETASPPLIATLPPGYVAIEKEPSAGFAPARAARLSLAEAAGVQSLAAARKAAVADGIAIREAERRIAGFPAWLVEHDVPGEPFRLVRTFIEVRGKLVVAALRTLDVTEEAATEDYERFLAALRPGPPPIRG